MNTGKYNKTFLSVVLVVLMVASASCSILDSISEDQLISQFQGFAPRGLMNTRVARRTRNVDASLAGSCSVGFCVGNGGNCTGSNICVDNTYGENIGNFTNTGEYVFTCTCRNYLPIGANCSLFSTAQCEYQCVDGICRPEAYQSVSPGGKCDSDSDCQPVGSSSGTSINPTCTNGRCSGGTPIGQPCNVSSSCLNSFCSQTTFVCTPLIASGGACNSVDQNSCFTECVNGTCIGSSFFGIVVSDSYFVGVGANCSGAFCDGSTYCGTDGICHPSSQITNSACDLYQNCTNGLICECNGNTGNGQCSADSTSVAIIKQYLSSTQNYQTCFYAQKCQNLNYADQCTACTAEVCQALKATSAVNLLFYVSSLSPTCATNYYKAQINSDLMTSLQQYNCPVNSSPALRVFGPAFTVVALFFLFAIFA